MKYIVEHMEPDLGEWAKIEYEHMLKWVGEKNLILSHLDENLFPVIPKTLAEHAVCTKHNVQTLDIDQSSILLLDPSAPEQLSPEDGDKYKYLLFGGILGDDPPQDRTKLLRKLGFDRRHLGPKQLPTDHAVIFSKMVLEDKVSLENIPSVDFPEIKLSKKESIQLPFRYLANENNEPILAPGMLDMLRRSNDEPLI